MKRQLMTRRKLTEAGAEYKAILDSVLEDLAAGKSLREICESPGFPSRQSVMRLCLSDDEFAARYMRARDLGYKALIDKAMCPVNEERRVTSTSGGLSAAELSFWERVYLECTFDCKVDEKLTTSDRWADIADAAVSARRNAILAWQQGGLAK